MKLNEQKVALTFGALASSLHLVWSVLVFFGWAQPLVNFVLGIHMLVVPVQVTGFDFAKVVTLLVVTFGVGYAVGHLFAWLWNKVQSK